MYARAGALAEKAAAPLLAIEAYRCAGQVALGAGSSKSAIELWQRALRVGSGAPVEVAALSSAPLVARTLAKFAREQGLLAASTSLLEQADNYESRALNSETSSVTGASHAGE
jgi:hypothetical protein